MPREGDTTLGGPHSLFPQTQRSAVFAARSDDPRQRREALDKLITAYWKPAYKHIRLKWNAANEEAKDLTQGFFVHAAQRELIQRYDPQRAAFRTYLRLCLDGYVANERKAAARQKRGGGQVMLSLDFAGAESELQRGGAARASGDDEQFRAEWIRSLFGMAVDRLRTALEADCKRVHFQLFEAYDLCDTAQAERPTYAVLAERFGLPVTQVTNFLAAARREFRRTALEVLRELCGNEQEFAEEARQLFGAAAP